MSEIQIRCTYQKMIPIAELKKAFHPRNSNRHPDDQITRLAKIMEYQGIRKPAVISNLSGNVTAGHGRIMAAERAGLEEYPCDFQDYDNEDQEIADLTADNAIALWADLDLSLINHELQNFSADFDINMLGIENFKLDVAEKAGLTDPDAVPENVETRCKLGDVWQLGSHRLMCGDSTSITDVEKLMAGEKADMVFTDPPYNVALGVETVEQAKARNRRTDGLTIKNDKMSDSDFRQFLTDAFSSMAAVTNPGSAIYVAHADKEGYNFRGAARDTGWLIKQCLIWKKSSLVMGRQDYQSIHEPILYGWLDGGSHQWYGDRKQTTVLEFQKPSRNGEHPTMKPVELVEYCLCNSSKSQDVILDLFGGSGTTVIAAERLGRSARLMELDPHYCDVILKRWEEYTGQVAVLAQ